jgi:hypothetical protein
MRSEHFLQFFICIVVFSKGNQVDISGKSLNVIEEGLGIVKKLFSQESSQTTKSEFFYKGLEFRALETEVLLKVFEGIPKSKLPDVMKFEIPDNEDKEFALVSEDSFNLVNTTFSYQVQEGSAKSRYVKCFQNAKKQENMDCYIASSNIKFHVAPNLMKTITHKTSSGFFHKKSETTEKFIEIPRDLTEGDYTVILNLLGITIEASNINKVIQENRSNKVKNQLPLLEL